MPLRIRYMGTKRAIAPIVADVIRETADGPLLDLFSGMAAIGTTVAPSRPIWCNDAQRFAAYAAAALFTSSVLPPNREIVADLAHSFYTKNSKALQQRFVEAIETEQRAISEGTASRLLRCNTLLPIISTEPMLEQERRRLHRKPNTFPYRLFTITFSGGYLGISQAIQADSIRYAVDILLQERKISKETYRWMILGLCQAVCHCATTTGHFAQYIQPKQNNIQRYLSTRRRSIWLEWLKYFDDITPIGSKEWRKRNKVFNKDAIDLLYQLKSRKSRPGVIYADPPYTRDQYSRYYHIYETIILYDYPQASGTGRVRPDRFISTFSQKSRVDKSISALIFSSALLGSDLVLSYPNNGILEGGSEQLLRHLRSSYRHVELVHSLPHKHSTMGASKGHSTNRVIENIYWAKQ